MSNTTHLQLPMLEASQAQKHVTVNDTIQSLDLLVQLSALDKDLTAPPASPSDGDRYIVGASATGAWAGKDNEIAAYQDGAWGFQFPREGWLCWVGDEDKFFVFDGAGWTQSSGAGGGSGSYDLDGQELVLDADGDTSITADTDDVIDIRVGGEDQIQIADNSFKMLAGTGSAFSCESKSDIDSKFSVIWSLDCVGSNGTSDINYAQIAATINNNVVGSERGRVSAYIASGGKGADTSYTGLDILGSNLSEGYPIFRFANRHSAGASSSTLCMLEFTGNDNAGNFQRYARIMPKIVDATSGSSTGSLEFETYQSGANGTRMICAHGIYHPSATGGDKGDNTINFGAVYDDNSLLSCYVFDAELDGVIDEAKWDAKVPDRVHEQRDEDGELVSEQIEERKHDPMRRFQSQMAEILDPEAYAKFWRQYRHLPAMPEEGAFDPVADKLSTGDWIQRLLETVEVQAVHIAKLHDRLQILENSASIDPEHTSS